MRYDKSTLTAPSTDPEKKLYNLIHNAAPDISDLTNGKVRLGKIEGTAAGLDSADLPSLLIIRIGFRKHVQSSVNNIEGLGDLSVTLTGLKFL